jgi:hypothetical protein
MPVRADRSVVRMRIEVSELGDHLSMAVKN